MSHAFETLAYARKSGFTLEHAMGIAEATREHVMSDLVTKTDLKTDMSLIRAEMLLIKADMKSNMEKLELCMVIKLGSLISSPWAFSLLC